MVLGDYFSSRSFVAVGSGDSFPGHVYLYFTRRGINSGHYLARAASEIQKIKTLEYTQNQYMGKEGGELPKRIRSATRVVNVKQYPCLSTGTSRSKERRNPV